VTALLAAGAVLRVLFLGARSLWFDEASSLIMAGLPLAKLPALLVRNEMNPPLYYALMHVWLKAFSDPRLGLRVFSALCGLASLAVFRSLSARVLPARARLLALFLAAFSSYWIHAAQDGRVYACLLLVALLEARVVWVLAEAPSPRRWAAYALLSALGLHLHYYFVFPLAAHAAWLAWRFRSSPSDLRAWAAAHAVVCVLFAPWLGPFLAQVRAHARDLAVGEALTPRRLADVLGTMFFDVTFLGLALPSWLTPAVGTAFAAVAGAGAVRVLSARTGEPERRALAFALTHLFLPLALVVCAELVVGRPITQARYFFPLSPFAFLIAALVLSSRDRRALAPRLVLEAAAAAGVVGYFTSGQLVDPHLNALAAVIRRGSDRRMPIVYVETYYYLPMRVYYLPERVHLLAAEAAEGMDYAAIPPYDGVAGERRQRALGPCVVLDEKRLLSPQPRWLGTGAQVAGLIARADDTPLLRRSRR
jgi:uncharacterized membrane protein